MSAGNIGRKMEPCEENNSNIAALLPPKNITQPCGKIGYFNQNSMKEFYVFWLLNLASKEKCSDCVENIREIH